MLSGERTRQGIGTDGLDGVCVCGGDPSYNNLLLLSQLFTSFLKIIIG